MISLDDLQKLLTMVYIIIYIYTHNYIFIFYIYMPILLHIQMINDLQKLLITLDLHRHVPGGVQYPVVPEPSAASPQSRKSMKEHKFDEDPAA